MMTTDSDIRWKQRFENYQKAVRQLTRFIEKEELNELEQQGLIQAFEFTHELAWKLMKDYLAYQGVFGVIGSRDAVRRSIEQGLIDNPDQWIEMIGSRNLTSHTYNETIAAEIAQKIKEDYHLLFVDFMNEMQKRTNG